MIELKEGSTLNLKGGVQAVVGKKIGQGGQGIVYHASVNGKPYALKWYTCKFADKDRFRKNLEKNIAAGSPCDKFLWPLYLTEDMEGSFGYVMNLRPKEYAEFSDILNNAVRFPSTELVITSALNIVDAFRVLHQKGYSYQDLNDGNFFINVNNGDVLICDNDNITGGTQKNPGNVGGKPGYMAPEIVTGNAHPSADTDYYSLAVILFKLFIRHDPLMGEAYVKSVCITEQREIELYGSKPVFIFDPNDASNRPVRGVHFNALNLWPLYPAFFQEAFVRAFCEGMKNPDKRLTEAEWQKVLIRLRDNLLVCPCGKGELFLSRQMKGTPVRFPDCGHTFAYPYRLETGVHKVPLFPGKKLYACHTDAAGSRDFSSRKAEVITGKKDPSLWGIKNLSQDMWTFTPPSGGEANAIGNGGVIPIGDGVSITFNNIDAKIVKVQED